MMLNYFFYFYFYLNLDNVTSMGIEEPFTERTNRNLVTSSLKNNNNDNNNSPTLAVDQSGLPREQQAHLLSELVFGRIFLT